MLEERFWQGGVTVWIVRRREQRPRGQTSSISATRISEIVRQALPNETLGSFEHLQGGSSNLSYLLRFAETTDSSMVLRIYMREPLVCSKELDLLRAASHLLPVPEVIHADPEGKEDIGPYMLYRFADGITFQELKSKGSRQDTASAARAIGASAARIQIIEPPVSVPARAISLQGLTEECLNSPLLKKRLGGQSTDRLSDLICDWLPQVRLLYDGRQVVHGDFNNRNTIVKREGDGWKVSAILDWELAYLGCPLWDAARFICYERRTQPCREPYFSIGFREGGGILPKNWATFCRVINSVSAAEGLARPELPVRFVPELRELILATLDERDPA